MNNPNPTQQTLTPPMPMLIDEMREEYRRLMPEMTLHQLRLMLWILADEDSRMVSSHPESTEELMEMTSKEAQTLAQEIRLQELGLVQLGEELDWTLTEKGLLAINYLMAVLHQEIQEAIANRL